MATVLPPEPSPASRQPFSQAGSPTELAEVFMQERERLREENQRRPTGRATCHALADRADRLIQRLWELALPDEAAREQVLPQLAIVATGGYGRRELSPHSDIDVTFIVAEEEDATLDATVRQMFLWLMEVFGQRLQLKVGYGYRTVADLAQIDHQSLTALLDARLIAGSPIVLDRFNQELTRHLWPAAFVRQKVAEREQVRRKNGDTPYLVEPAVREGRGGLRDIHLAEWLAAVAFPTTRGDVWRQLQRAGVVSRRDVNQLAAAREFLLQVRNWLHFDAGRNADRLVRERQERLALALGYGYDDELSAVERLMAQYYQHAENVARVSGFVVDRALAERLSLTDELVAVGGEVAPGYPWVNVTGPGFLVGLCEQFQEHGLLPGHELRRMIAEHMDECEDLSADREAARRFLNLLRAHRGVHATLELLASLGILQRWLPELGAACYRVPYDAVHHHTVGHHSLQVVRFMEELRWRDDESFGEFRRAWSEVEGPELLFLAALLHDVGKLRHDKGHAITGAEMSEEICARLGMDASETARVVTLVRQHLLMSDVAQLRDLTQERTIRDFAEKVNTRDLLNMLLLLTCADMEATGVLTTVRVRFLKDLYYRTDAYLVDETDQRMDPERLRKYRSRLSRRLANANLTPEQIRQHCEGMPVAYLLNTPPEEIAAHIRMVAALDGGQPVVEYSDDFSDDISVITLCTYDQPRPGLLSRIAGVLYALEVSVHAAQVFTRSGEPSLVLDTLWSDFHGRQLPPTKKLEVEQSLLTVIGGGDLEALLARHHKQLPPALPPERIRFDNEVAEHHTVLELRAPDQPGLLYRVTRAIASLDWHIHSARISTLGERARDAFYLTDSAGNRLDPTASDLEGMFLQAYMAE